MPRKKGENNQPTPGAQEIRDAVNAGYFAQTNDLDRFLYVANVQGFANRSTFLVDGHRDPEIYDDDENLITDPETLAKAREAECASCFTVGEQERLEVEEDPLFSKTLADHSDDLMEKLAYDLADNVHSMDDVMRVYQTIGMIDAYRQKMQGEAYEKHLNSPELAGEENREQKAEYLTLSSADDVSWRSKAIDDITGRVRAQLTGKFAEQRKSTIFRDAESMKQAKLKDFVKLTDMTPEEAQRFYSDNARTGCPSDPDASVYDLFRARCEKREELKKAAIEKQGGSYQVKTPTDAEIIDEGFPLYRDLMEKAGRRIGRDMIRSNANEADGKRMDLGAGLADIHFYDPPKQIKTWVKEKGLKLSVKDRVDQYNSNYDANRDRLMNPPAATLGFEKSSLMSGSFPRSADEAPAYDKYVAKHSGVPALGASPKDRKIHLCKLMAATALKQNGEPYSVKKIHAMAETISKLKTFQKLNDVEVNRGLFNSKSARRLQVDLLKKTYCVEPGKAADYIQKMQKLQANMKPKGSQSDEYKAMRSAVEHIASLDPQDPDVAFKLMQANERMFNSINGYAKGKKSVRTFEEGRNRFDNCMDALSVVSDHVPGLRDYAKQIVDRTNKVRGVQEGDEHFVDLGNFGAARAEEAQKAKQPAPQRVNDAQSRTLT